MKCIACCLVYFFHWTVCWLRFTNVETTYTVQSVWRVNTKIMRRGEKHFKTGREGKWESSHCWSFCRVVVPMVGWRDIYAEELGQDPFDTTIANAYDCASQNLVHFDLLCACTVLTYIHRSQKDSLRCLVLAKISDPSMSIHHTSFTTHHLATHEPMEIFRFSSMDRSILSHRRARRNTRSTKEWLGLEHHTRCESARCVWWEILLCSYVAARTDSSCGRFLAWNL